MRQLAAEDRAHLVRLAASRQRLHIVIDPALIVVRVKTQIDFSARGPRRHGRAFDVTEQRQVVEMQDVRVDEVCPEDQTNDPPGASSDRS